MMYSDLMMSCLVKFPGFLSVPNATTMRFPTSYTKRLVPSKVSYVSEPGGCFLLGGLHFFPLGAQMSQHVQTTQLFTPHLSAWSSKIPGINCNPAPRSSPL